jgi:hypothetical protein
MRTLAAGLICAAQVAGAQGTPINLAGFGWGAGNGNQANWATVEMDTAVRHGGVSSARVATRPGAVPTVASSVIQLIKADSLRGKRVRFAAYIRTRNAGGAGLLLMVNGEGRTLAMDNGLAPALAGTTEWTRREVVVDVPNTAIGIIFGVLLRDTGEAWIDDASVEIVGDQVPVTLSAMAVTQVNSGGENKVAQQRGMFAGFSTSLQNAGLEPVGSGPRTPPPFRSMRVNGWGGGGASPSSAYAPDWDVFHGGTSSGHLASRSTNLAEYITLSQFMSPADYRGKRVRFSAWVRTRNVEGAGAGLWMRVDGDGASLAFDNMNTRMINGSAEWTQVSVVLDVPADAEGVAIGFLLRGRGDAWVDDATFEVVGNEVQVTAPSRRSPNSTTRASLDNMYAFARTKPENLGFEQPRP